MAKKVVIQVVDDLDGTVSDDVVTVQFALDGVTYEIDLTEKNADQFRGALANYIAAARRVRGRAKRAVRNRPDDTSSAALTSRASRSSRTGDATKKAGPPNSRAGKKPRRSQR